jgi:hypothetical protein
MLFAKIQGSEPILLDQTQLTDESKLKSFFPLIRILFFEIVIALSDDNSMAYVEDIKTRRYTKEFHSFVKNCVATRLESR